MTARRAPHSTVRLLLVGAVVGVSGVRHLRTVRALRQARREAQWLQARLQNTETERDMAESTLRDTQEEASLLRSTVSTLLDSGLPLPPQVIPPQVRTLQAGGLIQGDAGWQFHLDQPPTDGVILTVEHRGAGDPPFITPPDQGAEPLPGGFTVHLTLRLTTREEPLHVWLVEHATVQITQPT